MFIKNIEEFKQKMTNTLKKINNKLKTNCKLVSLNKFKKAK